MQRFGLSGTAAIAEAAASCRYELFEAVRLDGFRNFGISAPVVARTVHSGRMQSS